MERTTKTADDIFTAAMLPPGFPVTDGSQPCATVGDKDAFFPSAREAANTQKRICRSCAFVQPCGEYALFHPEEEGVWGAMTETERRKLRRRMGIA